MDSQAIAAERWLRLVTAVLMAGFLAGCAHSISITPDLSKLDAPSPPRRGTVGLYVSPEDRARQVVTPGGGGDKVSYYPYRDMESGIYKVLGNVYERVIVVASPTDVDALTRSGVSIVARPQIITQSSSDSALTWPPTFFQVQLACSMSDISGTKITETVVDGTGRAEFGEFKSDFSLAGKRAAEDALRKTQAALLADQRLQ